MAGNHSQTIISVAVIGAGTFIAYKFIESEYNYRREKMLGEKFDRIINSVDKYFDRKLIIEKKHIENQYNIDKTNIIKRHKYEMTKLEYERQIAINQMETDITLAEIEKDDEPFKKAFAEKDDVDDDESLKKAFAEKDEDDEPAENQGSLRPSFVVNPVHSRSSYVVNPVHSRPTSPSSDEQFETGFDADIDESVKIRLFEPVEHLLNPARSRPTTSTENDEKAKESMKDFKNFSANIKDFMNFTSTVRELKNL